MRHRIAVLALLGALSLAGCPREPDAPEPLMGMPCEQLSDCNPGVSCGALKLCVEGPRVGEGPRGYCEEGASLIRPCRGAGDPVRPPEP